MDLGLKDKKAIVTGATKGIGRRIVDRLAAEGCNIALCSRTEEDVKATIADLESKGVEAYGSACHVRDGEAYAKWLESAIEELGGVDIFIPNVSAGGGMDSEKNWWRNFEIDVLGAVRGCEAVVPHMKKGGGGSVVFISTTAAVETFMAPQAYNAMKASLITYAKQMGQAYGRKEIRFNTVSPGPIYFEGGQWEMIKGAMPDLYEQTLADQPSGRMGTPEEVANVVVFLASPAASWVSGANVVVDGGFTKRVQF